MHMCYEISPCVTCVRVKDPNSCENKCCGQWRSWFLSRWALLHAYPRRQMEQPVGTVGVMVGGVRYAAPHQVKNYLAKDPCRGCACTQDLCPYPCRARQNWAKAHGEVLQ